MVNSLFFLGYIAIGIVVGVIYLLLLWRNVNQLPEKNRTKTWFLFNAFFRVLLVVTAFYYLSAGDFYHIIALLFGFMIVRYLGVKKL